MDQTGKGRGGVCSTGLFDQLRPTASGHEMKTEGAMPSEPVGTQTMGHVKPQPSEKQSGTSDEFQRALEGELVLFLREQNSKLLDEVANLKGMLRKSASADSGMGSSPWSAVGGTSNGASTGDLAQGVPGVKVAIPQQVRPGRTGSRTPRARVRGTAASPEKDSMRSSLKHTPNGTRVPDGPPPDTCEADEHRPPVPPFPMAVEDERIVDGPNGSFFSDMYDTCVKEQGKKWGSRMEAGTASSGWS